MSLLLLNLIITRLETLRIHLLLFCVVITKRRIGLTSREIKEAIDGCDVSKLAGEFAELLLKFAPTQEEARCEP